MAKRKTTREAAAKAAAPGRMQTKAWLAGRWDFRLMLLGASLAAMALGVYYNSLSNGFVSDDNFQLLNNPLVTDWRYLPVMMRTNVWALSGAEITNYYRP